MSRRLLVLDSGVGGLTVAREIRRQDQSAEIVYVADDAAFPYGGMADLALVEHVVALVQRVVAAEGPDVVVVACNTASTLVLPPLRARLDVPVVGTVPAVKPAAKASRTNRFSVLATPGTIRRDYTRGLIATHAPDCDVTLVGAPDLAGVAERFVNGHDVDHRAVAVEIAPAFVDDGGRRTDTVVLGCTHYAFLSDVLETVAPWPVTWIDSAPAIARRAISLLPSTASGVGGGHAIATSGRAFSPSLMRLLASIGLSAATAPAD